MGSGEFGGFNRKLRTSTAITYEDIISASVANCWRSRECSKEVSSCGCFIIVSPQICLDCSQEQYIGLDGLLVWSRQLSLRLWVVLHKCLLSCTDYKRSYYDVLMWRHLYHRCLRLGEVDLMIYDCHWIQMPLRIFNLLPSIAWMNLSCTQPKYWRWW